MAELTSMMHRVCATPQLSLPLLLQNNGTLNSSPVDHTSSLPAHCRSTRRSAPPVLHCPLQFNRLDFHLIRASFFIFDSHCNLISFFKVPRICISSFLFSLSADCQTHLSPLQLWTQFYFPLLFPPGLSCCQLSFSTLCNMNLAGFWTSWFCSNTPLRGNQKVCQRLLPHGKIAVSLFSFKSLWAVNSPCFAKYYGYLLCFSCAPRCNRSAAIREVCDLKQSSCIAAFFCRNVDLPLISILLFSRLKGYLDHRWLIGLFMFLI